MANEMEGADTTEARQLQAARCDYLCNIHPNQSYCKSVNHNQSRSRLLCCFDPSQLYQYYCQVSESLRCCIRSDLPRSLHNFSHESYGKRLISHNSHYSQVSCCSAISSLPIFKGHVSRTFLSRTPDSLRYTPLRYLVFFPSRVRLSQQLLLLSFLDKSAPLFWVEAVFMEEIFLRQRAISAFILVGHVDFFAQNASWV